MIFKDGESKEGLFANNCFVRQCKITNAKGDLLTSEPVTADIENDQKQSNRQNR
jgi:hypothetical protein